MSGIVGGWLTWIAWTSLTMAVVCFVVSLVTRHFLSGVTLVVVTTVLMSIFVLIGLASGMAQSDFNAGVLLPYALLALVIAGAWLLGMKVRQCGRKAAANR